jgi:hypothetical protein
MGVVARWGDRAAFIVMEGSGRSLWGFVKANWVRLLIRPIVTCYIFYLLVDEGLVPNRLVAISLGISADVIVESFLDRAKRVSEGVIKRIGNGVANGSSPPGGTP